MNYPQALAWLYDTQLHGIKPGLENMRRLLDALGFHGKNQRFIHVAGTNGKGSVCAMLDAICRAQGIRTGLFTSPHLIAFRERICIDGKMIAGEDAAGGLTRIRAIVSYWKPHPTFFEIATALALDHFQRENADVVVLETGMGGRLDATNVIAPAVGVITQIGFDHQAWLGETLREIATEKAGIIKTNVPLVSAAQADEAGEVLRETAARLQAVRVPVAELDPAVEIALPGAHQKLNAALAVAALRAAKIEVRDEAVRTGLRTVVWPGRFQRVGERLVLDGAHNESAVNQLVLTWREVFAGEKPAIILGAMRDKDLAAICARLAPLAARFITTPVRSPRTSSAEELRDFVLKAAPAVFCETAPDFPSALAIAESKPERILITGSLFLVGEALAFLSGAKPEMSTQ